MGKDWVHAVVMDKKSGKLVSKPMKFDSSNSKIEKNMKEHIETAIRHKKRIEGK